MYCLTIGAYGRDGDLVVGLTAALAWELPSKVDSKISNLLHRRSRSVVYPKMEAFLQSWVSCRYIQHFSTGFSNLSTRIRPDEKYHTAECVRNSLKYTTKKKFVRCALCFHACFFAQRRAYRFTYALIQLFNIILPRLTRKKFFITRLFARYARATLICASWIRNYFY